MNRAKIELDVLKLLEQLGIDKDKLSHLIHGQESLETQTNSAPKVLTLANKC